MSEEIPLIFVGKDELSAIVKNLTALLGAFAAAEDKAKTSTKELTEEEKRLADQMKRAKEYTEQQKKAIEDAKEAQEAWGKKLEAFHAKIEIVKAGIELAKGVYESLKASITSSLASWDQVTARAGKTNSSLGSVKDGYERLTKTQEKYRAEIGKILEGSGAIQSAMSLWGGILKDVTKILKDNEKAIQTWVQGVAQDLLDATAEVSRFMRENADTIEAVLVSVKMLDEAMTAWMATLKAQVNLIKLAILTPLTTAVTVLAEVTEGYTLLAELIGLPFAAKMRELQTSFQGVRDSLQDTWGDTLFDLKDNVESFTGALKGMVGELGLVGQLQSGIGSFFEGIVSRVRTVKKKLADSTGTGKVKGDPTIRSAIQQIELQKAIALSITKNQKMRQIELEYAKDILTVDQSLAEIKNKKLRDLTREAGYLEALNAKREKEKALAEEIKNKNMEIIDRIKAQGDAAREKAISDRQAYTALAQEEMALRANVARQEELDELAAIGYERRSAELALELELLGIEDKKLRATTEAVRRAQIDQEEREKSYTVTLDYLSRINEAVSSAFDQPLSLFDAISSEQMERYGLALEKSNAAIERRFELGLITEDQKERELAQNERLAQQEEERLERLSKIVSGMANVAKGSVQLTTSIRAYNAVGATAAQQQDAINAGLQAGTGILSSVTQSFVEDKRTQAGIEALINAAAAAASYATGNIPAGIGYTAAAVTYGAAAAFGGGSAPSVPTGASGSSGGSSGGASSLGMIDLDRERSLNAEAIAEAMRSEGRGGATQITVVMQGNTVLSESPEIADEITRYLKRSMENEGFLIGRG